jgi:gluconate kinase
MPVRVTPAGRSRPCRPGRLHRAFAAGDGLHSAANTARMGRGLMRRGIPSDDEDRRPHLEALAGVIRKSA